MEQTILYLVLDSSGSMYGKPVMQGAMELLEEHKKLAIMSPDNTNYRLTLCTFSNEMTVHMENVEMENIDLENFQYTAQGMTDLWNTVWKVLAMTGEKEEMMATRHILFILTDGENTVSSPYTPEMISNEVQRKKEKGMDINILWIGSNGGQGWGSQIGGSAQATLDFDDDYMLEAIRSGSGALHRFVSGNTDIIEFTDIERDTSSLSPFGQNNSTDTVEL
jgi:uncharacterized protein YegL